MVLRADFKVLEHFINVTNDGLYSVLELKYP